MKEWRQVLLGIVAALFSTAIIIGSMVLALAEGGRRVAQAFTITPSPQATVPGQMVLPSSTSIPSPTPTPETVCEYPAGWQPYLTQPGDTLVGIAASYGVSIETLQAANCLAVPKLFASGIDIYVPAATVTPTASNTPTATTIPPTKKPKKKPSATPCRTPTGWVVYIVKRGDNLYRIGLAYGLTALELQRANCLPNDKIITGQRLRVPNIPTKTVKATRTPVPTTPAAPPSPTNTAPPVNTPSAAPTATPVPPTVAPTHTFTPPPPPTTTFTPIPPTPTIVITLAAPDSRESAD